MVPEEAHKNHDEHDGKEHPVPNGWVQEDSRLVREVHGGGQSGGWWMVRMWRRGVAAQWSRRFADWSPMEGKGRTFDSRLGPANLDAFFDIDGARAEEGSTSR